MKTKPLIHLFGASGSGTSTLGEALAKALCLRWMDTDDYYWLPADPPFTQKRPKEERLRLIEQDFQASPNGAALSGSLSGWGDSLMPLFTLAVRVTTDTSVRLERIGRREHARFGARIEPGGDMHQAHLAFLKWAGDYDAGGLDMRSRAEHDLWQRQLTCPLLIVDGAQPLDVSIGQVLRAMDMR